MMKMNWRTLLVVAGACSVLALSACGSTGSISSLTDSDTTTEITDATAEADGSVLTGAVEATESSAEAYPEIAAQTIEPQQAQQAEAPEEEPADTEEPEDEDTEEPADLDDTEDTDEDDEGNEPAVGTPEEYGETLDLEDVEPAAEEEEEVVAAGEGNTAVCMADEINVRSYPEVDEDDDNVMGTIHYGEEVTVLGNEDGWYKIEFDGEIGYVSANYFE